ncbi:hypothetical protein AV530_010800 [Patagioenas fasciata monilis]|uniref:Uncharacterized protein n=1 Tax=Patagioenas fasciata monilis TaxID=372326 RepID=A0A1V4K9B9_PATFA|nr:hypothetical protein AV530_010800 [Patagioenas fasciata monilis]
MLAKICIFKELNSVGHQLSVLKPSQPAALLSPLTSGKPDRLRRDTVVCCFGISARNGSLMDYKCMCFVQNPAKQR